MDPSPFVLMAGGIGGRMRRFDGGRSKLLFEVGGTPLLGHLLQRLASAGVRNVNVLAGFRYDDVADYVGSRWTSKLSNLRISVLRDKQLGTQRALDCLPSSVVEGDFVILDAATLFSVDLLRRLSTTETKAGTVVLTRDLRRAWHHSMAAVTPDSVIRDWWLEDERPSSLAAGEHFGRNTGALKVDRQWISLDGLSTAHAIRAAVRGNLRGPIQALEDDGGYRHFGTPREFGVQLKRPYLHR